MKVDRPNQLWCIDIKALHETVARFGPPGIMHTDQGNQFTGSAWTPARTEAGVRISMGGVAKIFIECLWRSSKQEEIHFEELIDGFQAHNATARPSTSPTDPASPGTANAEEGS